MALTKNSTILISDISSALSEKQDKLTYIPVKSVNGTSADVNGAVTISTGGGTAIAVSNVAVGLIDNGNSITLPSGGTWKWMTSGYWSDDVSFGMGAGGTTVYTKQHNYKQGWIAIRIA